MTIYPDERNQELTTKQNEITLKTSRLFGVILAVLSAVFVFAVIKLGINESTNELACAEVEANALLQTTILKMHMNDQYEPLMAASMMLEDGETFGGESARVALNAIKQTHELCIFGFANLEGDVTNCIGEYIGNIWHRDYFQNIINGTSTWECEYVESTVKSKEPRIIFSCPAYDQKGNLIGALFSSKELNVLKRALFENDLFGTGSSYFICDEEGKVLVDSIDSAKECGSDLLHRSPDSIFDTIPELKELGAENGKSREIEVDGKPYFTSMIPLGVNDWKVGCIVDGDAVAKEYAGTAQTIRKITYEALAISGIAIGYILVLALQSISRKRHELYVIKKYNHNYRTLLRELNCTVVEYSPEDSSVNLIHDSCRAFDLQKLIESENTYQEYVNQHPEFGFEQLKDYTKEAIRKKEPQTFESILRDKDEKPHWLKVILIPMISDTGYIKILGTTLDVTNMHEELFKMAETYAQVPGGIHRVRLSSPKHIEFYSEGLCEMLGYTHHEVGEILGPEMNYLKLIHPEDRKTFSEFCRRLSESERKEMLEYRMLCKDGSVITVVDTAESKRSSTGIMYGYSVVVDSKMYKQAQAALEKELAETKADLEELKIKNFTSQMQPHFLYNALASIREIVLDDPEYASELLCDFTTHLRACLRSVTSDTLVPFSRELENIEAYVRIEKMRFGDRLEIRYECEEQDFLVIPLGIQPLVENAIRHGIYERGKQGGMVIVRTARKQDNIEVVVEDNGVGFDYDSIMQEIKAGTRDSTGMFNLIFRFERILNAKVKVESQPGVGTRITILIPIKEEER